MNLDQPTVKESAHKEDIETGEKKAHQGDLRALHSAREHYNTLLSQKEKRIIEKIKKSNEEGQKSAIKKLIIVSFICIFFMTAELVGGIISDSLAIMSDAAHMLSDFSGFAISMISIIISRNKPTYKLSYGYHRAEVIGALCSILLIWGLTIWLVYEAIQKVLNDEKVKDPWVMLIVAIVGLICNIVMGQVLHSAGGHHGHSHGGGHGHSHGGKAKVKDSHGHSHGKEEGDHGHSHDKEDHGHSHDNKEDHGHSHDKEDHGHSHDKEDHGHSHDKEDHGHSHDKEDHGHSHDKEDHSHSHDNKEDHVHSHDNSNNFPAKPNPTINNISTLSEANLKEPLLPELSQTATKPKSKSKKKKEEHQHNHHHDEEEDEEDDHNSHDNLNIRAAFIHVIGDLIQSVGVVIAAIVILVWPNLYIVDPICTFFFSLLVVITTIPILCDCIRVFMEGTPSAIDPNKLMKDLYSVSGVDEVHDLHVWALNMGNNALSCHIKSHTPMISLKKATRLINTRYKILHTTIQVEPVNSAEVDFECETHH